MTGSKTARWVPVPLFFLSFAAFFAGASRVSGMGPGGVLTALLGTGGLPNPPGYPLIGLLTDLWLLIPHGNVAFHLNLFAAFQGAFLCVAVFTLVRDLRRARGDDGVLIPLTAVLLLTGMPLFYRHVFFFDRYLLSLLVFVGLLKVLFPVDDRRFSPARSFTAGAALTLLFGAHFFAFLAGAAFFSVWLPTRHALGWRSLPAFVAGLVTGLAPLGWNAWKAGRDPYFNWSDPRSWDKLRELLTRAERGEMNLVRPLEIWSRQIVAFMDLVQENFGPIVLSIAFAAALALFVLGRKNKPAPHGFRFSLLAALVAAALVPLVMINFSLGTPGSPGEGQSLWIAANYSFVFLLCLVLAATLGWGTFIDFLSSKRPAAGRALAIIGVLALFAGTIGEYRRHDSRDFRFTADLVSLTRSHFPAGSLLLTGIDSIYFPLMGEELARKEPGPFAVHIDLLFRPWYIETLIRTNSVDPSLHEPLLRLRDRIAVYMRGQIRGEELMESYLVAVHAMIDFYEKSAGAYLIDIDPLVPMRYGFVGRSTKEPFGYGDRLFTENSEMKGIDWRRDENALRALLKAPAEGPQAFWVETLRESLRAQLQKRIRWTAGVEPEESEFLRALVTNP